MGEDNQGMTAKRIRGRKLQAMRDRLFSHQPLCVMCQAKDIVRFAEERDHIVPLRKGGLDRESNTQALCKECHEAKTITEQGMNYNPRKPQGLDWIKIGGGAVSK